MHEPTTAKGIRESLFGSQLQIRKRGSAGPGRRHKPGCIDLISLLILDTALKEIKFYQKSTSLLIPLRPFSRLVRQVISEVQWGYGETTRITRAAFAALQCATEHAIITYFEMAFIPSS